MSSFNHGYKSFDGTKLGVLCHCGSRFAGMRGLRQHQRLANARALKKIKWLYGKAAQA